MALNFSIEELNDLKNDYINNKIYISRNPYFCKLENRIRKWFKDDKFIYKMSKDRLLYRTRVVDKDKIEFLDITFYNFYIGDFDG